MINCQQHSSRRMQVLILSILLLSPLSGFCYVKGDINNDDLIGLQESIYSLRVLAGETVPLSGTTINVPADIPTIQQAIDTASNGDTISIAAGTRAESLTITGKSIVLTGAGVGVTIIDGGGVSDVITIEHSNVVIKKMTIKNGLTGIAAGDRSSAEIDQVTVRNCINRGVHIDKNSNGVISNITSNNNGSDGIGITRNSTAYLTGAIITNTNSRSGLHMFLNSSALIENATFTGNANGESSIGVYYSSSLYTASTTFSMAENRMGLDLSSGSAAGATADTIWTITNSQQDAIGVYNNSGLNSRGKLTIQSSANGSAIGVGDSSSISLRGDVSISDTYYSGLSVSKESSATVYAKLEINQCSDDGISISRNSSVVINDTANIIVKNSLAAIGVYESVFRASGGTLLLQDNDDAGISVGRNATAELRKKGAGLYCTITGNLRGIDVYRGGYFRAEQGVTITSNTENGISGSSNSALDLRNITVASNAGKGIAADSGTDLSLRDSTFSNNSGGDVSLSFGALSSIYGAALPSTISCDSSVLSRGDKICP